MLTVFEALRKAATDFEGDNPMARISLKLRAMFLEQLEEKPARDPEVVYAQAYQFFMEKEAGVR